MEDADGGVFRFQCDGSAGGVAGNIDGQQGVNLSDGEYVVPSDVVSHLGNGSTKAGVGALEEMMNNIRQKKTGSGSSPPQVDPRAMMPM